jgi:hypothetical protein
LQRYNPSQPQEPASGTAWRTTTYEDPLLNDLERQIDISNPTLKASALRQTSNSSAVAEHAAGFGHDAEEK